MRYTFVILVSAVVLFAQEAQRDRSTPTETGTSVRDPIVDYYRSIADYFRNSERSVLLINKKGIKDEEIPAVLLIARRSSASPNNVISLRQGGKSFEDIARQYKVTLSGNDFVEEANIIFLSEYHGRTPEEVRKLHAKGATFVALNQEFRRSGGEPKRKTETAR